MRPSKVAVSGATGLVGRALCQTLKEAGCELWRLVRPDSHGSSATQFTSTIEWDPAKGVAQPQQLESLDAIVHLAGRSIASSRWTPEEKQRIRDSRVAATEKLVGQLCGLDRPPPIFVCASAIGIYGNSGDAPVDESSPPADDFLAVVAKDWEAACYPLRERGVRVVQARLGIVLDPSGGALAKLLPLFRWRLGGLLGDGGQVWSWIALEDCVRAIEWMLASDTASGPYNLAAPHAVSNREFTEKLAKVLAKPAWLPAPKFLLRAALGEMADALLLSSCRAVPRRLLAEGYEFHWPDLEPFLRAELQ